MNCYLILDHVLGVIQFLPAKAGHVWLTGSPAISAAYCRSRYGAAPRIVSTPSFAFPDRVVEAKQSVLIHAFRPELAVERFDERVVGRRARPKSSVTPFMYAHRSRSRETYSLP